MDKPERTSETEESASPNRHNISRQEEEDKNSGTNPADDQTAPILQMSQPFFVADTLEDDESIMIPPSQDDSASFMIPSTPCEKKSNRQEFDPSESTITMLEETCVDIQNDSKLKETSKEDDKESSACIEDLTEDLDLEPTQPIVPSNLMQAVEFRPNANKSEEEEEDDEWQLKFSESQTQELLNFNKANQKDEEPEFDTVILPNKEPDKNVDEEADDDDDLPATLSIEVPQRIEEGSGDSSVKVLEHTEALESQSEDEIEPSQSCLSEYKGETISTSYKVQSPEIHNNENSHSDIPKLHAEAEIKLNSSHENDSDVEVIGDSEKRTINLSESEPKRTSLDESKTTISDRTLSMEDISDISVKDGKNEDEIEHVCNDIEKQMKHSETKEKSFEKKDFAKSPVKTCEKEVIELIETNGEDIEEVKVDEDEPVEEITINEEDKSTKLTDEKDIKNSVVKCIPEGPITTNLDEHTDETVAKESFKPSTEKSDNSVEVIKGSDQDKIEGMPTDEKEKAPNDDDERKASHETSKDSELPKKDECREDEASDTKPLQKSESVCPVPEKIVKEAVSKSELHPDAVTPKKVEFEVVKASEITTDSQTTEIAQTSTKHTGEEIIDTPPISFAMAPPISTSRSLSSVRKVKIKNKTIYHDASSVHKKISIGSFKDVKSLQKCFKSVVPLEKEEMEMILSKPNEQFEIRSIFTIENQEVFLRDYSIESEPHRQESGISPMSGSSSTMSSSASKISSHSSAMGDISSFSSGKSANSCSIPTDCLNILSSQETASELFPKTSTQKSSVAPGFSEVFGTSVAAKNTETKATVSPIIPEEKPKVAIPKRKRAGKKNAGSTSSEASTANVPKRKRARVKAKARPDVKDEETEESKDSIAEVKPRKATRRKKGAAAEIGLKHDEIIAFVESVLSREDESSTQEEASFGSILPGVKVMARWKDGYYYSGMVQTQEVDGRWAVLFEDGYSRPITLENLIKIAVLPKGTSVMVQSPDDFYDPGIVCGHFREGNKVGYEVELDNGVTKRYPRSAVILSGDQAKLIISSRPPTTPPTMTINLDNIIDGKRKRKSVQSPIASPAVIKKSPRITRSKKPDSNLDSTAESSATDFVPIKSKESETEEPVKKKKKAIKGTKAVAVDTNTSIASTSSTASSSNSKTTKVLPQRSAKKLFKDYAFLLSNADRKPKPPELSASESYAEDEEDIVPFDKDELCSQIASGGGMVLEKFDDIKKCHRKHIFLLANTFLRTMKYIQCIASGISCIKHHWIQNSLLKAETLGLNSYILPSGYSLVSKQVIEWHGKTDVFKACKIALVSAPESPFVFTWAPLLLAAKADFVQKWNLPSSVSGCSAVVDVLITNNHCPPEIIQSAKKRKIPVVSSEWIIQCLILGKKLPFDAHPKFKYDYTEM